MLTYFRSTGRARAGHDNMLVVGMSNTHYTTACSGRSLQQAVSLRQQLPVFSTLMLAVGMSSRTATWYTVATSNKLTAAAHLTSFSTSLLTLDRLFTHMAERPLSVSRPPLLVFLLRYQVFLGGGYGA